MYEKLLAPSSPFPPRLAGRGQHMVTRVATKTSFEIFELLLARLGLL
jgi:hypothetical protein